METISYSLLKDLTRAEGYCGYYLDLIYNQDHRIEITDAMVDGLVFEQYILGKTARGEVYEIPRLKSGAVSKRETDLMEAVKFALDYLKANEIEFNIVQDAQVHDDRSGHVDEIGTYRGRGYMFDVKYTGMSFRTWDKELKWSDVIDRFTLQARHYQSLYKTKYPFMFLVFGPDWCRFFEVPYDAEMIASHCAMATDALETFNAMDPRPTSDARLCFTCGLRSQCDRVNKKIVLEPLINY